MSNQHRELCRRQERQWRKFDRIKSVNKAVKNFGYFDADEKDCVEEHTVYVFNQYRELCQRQERQWRRLDRLKLRSSDQGV